MQNPIGELGCVHQDGKRPTRQGTSIATLGTIFAMVCAATVQAQSGACCQSNGTCLLRDEVTCAGQGGDFLGVDVPCVINLCKGGCCRPTGECSLNIARLNCEVNGGTYLGHSSDCTGAKCPVLPTGACCRENFCQEGFTESACLGVWPGVDSTCNDCPGACCLLDNSCVETTRGQCMAAEGATFPRNLTVCPPDGCGQGACCFAATEPGDNCASPIDPFQCAASEGMYQGHGTDCGTVTCPLFGGGCCCGLSCFVTTRTQCTGIGCTYMGEGVPCGSNSQCPGDGACCTDGTCSETDGVTCVQGGGDYRGEGSTCKPGSCTTTPVGACCEVIFGSSRCSNIDQQMCENDGGQFRGAGVLCEELDPPCNGACCTGGGTCLDGTTPEACPSPGGRFLGMGSVCEADSCGACCYDDGSCLRPIRLSECLNGGGSFRSRGVCEGDTDGDGVDDACKTGACCFESTGGPETTCENGHTRGTCGGEYVGDDTICLGDKDGTGVDDVCERCHSDKDCFDAVFCTDDTCDPKSGQCRNVPSDLFCLDETACTTNERCDTTLGCLFDVVDCNDGLSCTIDTCDPVLGCLHGADNSQCDDGVDCTVDLCRPNRPERDANGCVFDPDDLRCPTKDLCVPGRCDSALGCQFEPRECPDDGDACTREFCDPQTGDCLRETICGACCRVGQPCIDGLTVAQCAGAFDTFMGLGTSCETAPCGACCDLGSGACFDGITVSECDAAGRGHLGADTNCTENRCLGACCDPGFTVAGCTDGVSAAGCAAIDTDAIFLGVGATCSTAACGACCDPLTSDRGTSCLDAATPGFCAALGYNYMGDRTTCDVDRCRGACCQPDGSCVLAAPEECGGDFRGNGTDCGEVNPPCAPFQGGACCLPNDNCLDGTSPQSCTVVHAGRYQGDTTRCADLFCEETGACCLDDGRCVQSTEIGCVDGVFQGPGTSCADSCQGACCLATGACVVTRMQGCPGEYRGDGTNCSELEPACSPDVEGACCTIDGCLDGQTRIQCEEDPRNDFRGVGTHCESIDCLGACCVIEGTTRCEFVTRNICANFGALYLGDGIHCFGNTCGDCTTDLDCPNEDRCDGDEFCDNGHCSSTPPPTINDGVDCTLDICDPQKGVLHEPRDAECDEGNPCREYFCDPIHGCFHLSTCDDGDPCTDDLCTDSGQCLFVPIICDDDDSLFCNGSQVCVDGVCLPGGPTPCNPSTDVCDENHDRCVPRCETDADCLDGLFCNGIEVCSQFTGGCAPGIPPCRRADQVCDESVNRCVDLCIGFVAGGKDCVRLGDGDGNGRVDLIDARILFNAFGQDAPPGDPTELVDLNRDGRIGFEDIASFVGALNGPS